MLGPGEQWDPVVDHPLVIGTGGLGDSAVDVLRGAAKPAPIGLAAGKTHRLRLINITSENVLTITLMNGASPAEWRAIRQRRRHFHYRRRRVIRRAS